MSYFDISKIDTVSFTHELDLLKQQELQTLGKKDLNHLRRTDLALRVLFWLGIISAAFLINPISALLISTAKTGRWAMLGHHVGHGGYDKISGTPKKYLSKYFAKGNRRWMQWMDWLYPSAWEFEHNYLHHYHTSEIIDPDFVQKNVAKLRGLNQPIWLKYLLTIFLAAHWKLSYYAPNTWWYYFQKSKSNKHLIDSLPKEDEQGSGFPGKTVFSPFNAIGRQFWVSCILPYTLFNFILIPALFIPFGWQVSTLVLGNLLLAELFTNWHTFTIIVTNHAGEDLPYFKGSQKSKAEFYIRQIIGSVNYHGGKPWSDFMLGYTNYQIEHHLWPSLPMSSYARLQPKVQELCKKYNVPYLKENVFVRLKKLLQLMVGKTTMEPVRTEILS